MSREYVVDTKGERHEWKRERKKVERREDGHKTSSRMI